MKHLSFAAALALLSFAEAQAQDTVRTFSQRQVVEPCRVEVAFSKTLHILFPSEAVYVDLGESRPDRGQGGQGCRTSCASKPRNRASRERRTFRSSRPTDASTLSRRSIPRIPPGSTSRWRTGCTKIPYSDFCEPADVHTSRRTRRGDAPYGQPDHVHDSQAERPGYPKRRQQAFRNGGTAARSLRAR